MKRRAFFGGLFATGGATMALAKSSHDHSSDAIHALTSENFVAWAQKNPEKMAAAMLPAIQRPSDSEAQANLGTELIRDIDNEIDFRKSVNR